MKSKRSFEKMVFTLVFSLIAALSLFSPTIAFGAVLGYDWEVPNTLVYEADPVGSYDATTHTFNVTLDNFIHASVKDSVITDFTGTFDLTAQIDNSGNLISGSSTFIGGSASLGIAANTQLFTSSIIDFAIDPLSNFGFNFILDVSGEHPSIGFDDAVGVIISAPASTASTLTPDLWFTQDFVLGGSWSFSSIVDLEPVPEPTTLFLLGTGIAGLAGIRRKKQLRKR